MTRWNAVANHTRSVRRETPPEEAKEKDEVPVCRGHHCSTSFPRPSPQLNLHSFNLIAGKSIGVRLGGRSSHIALIEQLVQVQVLDRLD